jgi:hypothetical protein
MEKVFTPAQLSQTSKQKQKSNKNHVAHSMISFISFGEIPFWPSLDLMTHKRIHRQFTHY